MSSIFEQLLIFNILLYTIVYNFPKETWYWKNVCPSVEIVATCCTTFGSAQN